MSTSTTNLGLTKPSGNERPDVDIINANMDTIDAAIGAVGNVSLQSQITSLQESVSRIEIPSNIANLRFERETNYSLPRIDITFTVSGSDYIIRFTDGGSIVMYKDNTQLWVK